MGDVYRAWDEERGAEVALKLLHGAGPARWRFLREAEAQAAVVHPHVCPIFDAGEIGEVPFISMRIVEGPSLSEVRDRLDLEAQLEILRKVALAVHEAHRQGLIHRDLKPGNIAVEPDAAGRWTPFVMDFGLALGPDAGQSTSTGAVLGTPAYMAPEQAMGKGAPLDRRADVWSLGATLFFLLAGRAPFEGTTLEILVQVADRDPPRLRELRPDLPRALETILMRCLERRPEDRYDSAAALAEDLRRHLEKEPVDRPAGWALRRWGRRLRRYRALLGVSAAALAVLVGGGIVAVGAQLELQEQARWAQRFEGEVGEIEELLRYAALAPQHDVRPQRAEARWRVRRLEAALPDLGDAALAPGHSALGRAYQLLGRHELALEHLELAERLGVGGRELREARGRSLAALYREARRAADRIPEAEVRRAHLREAERRFRDPARSLLDSGRGRGLPSASAETEVLLLLAEGQHEDAIAAARVAAGARPWAWELESLVGEAEELRAAEATERGDPETALAAMARAREALLRAAEVARSEPKVQVSLCQVGTVLMSSQYRATREVEPWYSTSIGHCQRAARLDSGDAGAFRATAAIHREMARWRMNHEGRPGAELDAALEAARTAVRLDPSGRRSLLELATTETLRADTALATGGDPAPGLVSARQTLARLRETSPDDAETLLLEARLHDLEAELLWARGQDPRSAAERADRGFRAVLERVPGSADVALHRLYTTFWPADWMVAHGLDPAPFTAAAVRRAREVLRLDPTALSAYRTVAEHRILRARHLLEAGSASDPELALGERALLVAMGRSPAYLSPVANLVEIEMVRAESALRRERDARPFLEAARRTLAVQDLPERPWIHVVRTRLLRLEAGATSSGDRRLRLLREARAAADRALGLNERDGRAWLELARVELEVARASAGSERGLALARATEAVERCLEALPNLPVALAIRGDLDELAGHPDLARASRAAAAAGNPLLGRSLLSP